MLQYVVGGWDPPLGVAFRADGLSAVMIVTAALLICGIGLFARAQFPTPQEAEARAPLVFWTLLLAPVGGAERRLSRRRPVQSLMSPSNC